MTVHDWILIIIMVIGELAMLWLYHKSNNKIDADEEKKKIREEERERQKNELVEALKSTRNEMLTTNQLSVEGASNIFNALIYIIENTPVNKNLGGE